MLDLKIMYQKTLTVSNIDKVDPNEATIKLSKTTAKKGETVTATVTQSDGPSGVNINACKWVYNNNGDKLGTTDSLYNGGIFTNTTQDVTCGTNNVGTYYLHVLTVDKVGNKRETVSQGLKVEDSTYTLSYNLNGGSGNAPNSVKYREGATVYVDTSCKPTNPGYTFMGWTRKKGSSGDVVKNVTHKGAFKMPASDVVLYALWYCGGGKPSWTCSGLGDYMYASSSGSNGDGTYWTWWKCSVCGYETKELNSHHYHWCEHGFDYSHTVPAEPCTHGNVSSHYD